MQEIKKFCPNVHKIIYVTDGAKQHYKNRYQMCNPAHHKDDFDIEAEWHFHATAHGKGACDGVGAILKREATRASLQAKSTEAILTPHDLFHWAKGKFQSISFFYYSKGEYNKVKKSLSNRFANAPPVPKIQNSHACVVNESKQLLIFRYSTATEPITTVQY